jgi:tripartite-type tricarboxylate transporter receptor subunit TctC
MVVAAGAFAAVPVAAQEYPQRPIRIILPFPPGSSGDLMMRLLSLRLADVFRQSVIVDNRSGGAGIAAADLVAKAAPDGYTLFFTGINHVTNVGLFAQLPFDVARDFSAISLVGAVPGVLVVHPGTGFRSVKDLIDAAKAKPRSMNFGSAGNGTGGHLSMEMFMRAAGISMTHVPYKGATFALTDVVAGQVQALFTGLPPTLPLIKDSRLNALVVSGAKRAATLPNTPSMGEIGFANSDVQIWFGLVTRAGTPKSILQKISGEVARLIREPDIVDKMAVQGIETSGSSTDEFELIIRRDLDRLPRLIRESGIKAE